MSHLQNGIAGGNLQKLSEIGIHETNAGIPYVIAGDWNVEPSELLEQNGWLASKVKFGFLVTWKFPATPAG